MRYLSLKKKSTDCLDRMRLIFHQEHNLKNQESKNILNLEIQVQKKQMNS